MCAGISLCDVPQAFTTTIITYLTVKAVPTQINYYCALQVLGYFYVTPLSLRQL
ncbi:hypothetical protein C3B55_00918 [Candidatus Pseudomonas adelgestsugas]|uniref:Uncharacterized protein n=1 Tax=Candidatus Pseudomonas adelgestsugas TaxID=1302376 RepID=A0ABX5RAF7_9PSED|nr:hypothetical protein C3B55_00918 [Candidatus Pseudomonas adelgestsugas]